MTSAAAGTLDEAYERLLGTGPEFDGGLSNHGPMAAEAMIRGGHGEQVQAWLDSYMRRLEEFPRGVAPIGDDWRDALGDLHRVADWTTYFRREVAGRPWPQVLNQWWPRLLPGVAAAATHGVIRVGHAVRALRAGGDDEVRTAELAHGLAYWAARWQTVPAGHRAAAASVRTAAARGTAGPAQGTAAAGLLDAVPRITDQTGAVRGRLARLEDLPGWPDTQAALCVPAAPAEIEASLAAVVDAATLRYLTYGHGNAVMLVHSATAPSAILRALPALDTGLWAPSLAAAWTAACALTAIYGPAEPAPAAALPVAPAGTGSGEDAVAEAFSRAVEHGDAHVIKFTDTAADVFARTGNPGALRAAQRAAQLIGP